LRHPQPATPQAGRDTDADLAGGAELDSVEGAHRLDAAHGARKEYLASVQIVQGQPFLTSFDSLCAGHLDRLASGDAGEDAPIGGWRRQPPIPSREDASARCLQRGPVGVDQERQLSASGCRRGALEQPAVRPLVGAEAARDDNAAQGDALLGRGKDLHGLDLGRRDLGLQAAMLGHHGETKPSVPDALSAIEDQLANIAGRLGLEEGVEAGGEPPEMCVELDRPPVEDEHRLEDALIGIGVGGGEHAGIS
jgi:hypothetical protein